jgi:hypothetical protein
VSPAEWLAFVLHDMRTRAVRTGPLAGAVVAAVLLAGCSSSSGGSVTHINSTTASKGATQPKTKPSPLAFSVCMRAHGVPNFPDPSKPPQNSSGQPEIAPSGGFTANPNSPAYEAASNDCKSLALARPLSQAQSNQVMAAQLKFAVCMRANGVPNYPDPTNNGEIGNNGAINGVNPNSPAFQSAQKTCSRFLSPLPASPAADRPLLQRVGDESATTPLPRGDAAMPPPSPGAAAPAWPATCLGRRSGARNDRAATACYRRSRTAPSITEQPSLPSSQQCCNRRGAATLGPVQGGSRRRPAFLVLLGIS